MNENVHHRYAMFRNFLYNELGLTKEDIRAWTQEAVKEEVVKYLERNPHIIEDAAKQYVKISAYTLANDAAHKVANTLARKLYKEAEKMEKEA